jgi:hypothetical protein
MDGAHFIAALATANPRQAMAAQMIAAAVLALLGLVWAVPPPRKRLAIVCESIVSFFALPP